MSGGASTHVGVFSCVDCLSVGSFWQRSSICYLAFPDSYSGGQLGPGGLPRAPTGAAQRSRLPPLPRMSRGHSVQLQVPSVGGSQSSEADGGRLQQRRTRLAAGQELLLTPSPTGLLSPCPALSLQREASHFFGYVYFRQVKDVSVKRGYFQKVGLTRPHPSPPVPTH